MIREKQGFLVFKYSEDSFPMEIATLESYENIDGYLIGIYKGEHYASPTKEKPMICLQHPVPENKCKPKK